MIPGVLSKMTVSTIVRITAWASIFVLSWMLIRGSIELSWMVAFFWVFFLFVALASAIPFQKKEG